MIQFPFIVASNSILVIGGGAAGLAAARELSRTGRKVIVIEARDRVGGRVFTQKDSRSSAPIELGAEFIHGKSPELFQTAAAANRQVYEVSERHWYFQNGKIAKSGEFWRKIESLTDEMKSSARDQSLKEFLASIPDDEETRQAKSMLVRYVEGFHAANIERVGIHGLVKASEAADEIDGNTTFRLVDGYDALMRAMKAEAESYGATFHLSTIVKEVHWNSDRAEVRCESESPNSHVQIFTGDAAIITLPLGVLQSGVIRFVPNLPDDKLRAIDGLAMGDVIKINLQFRERFWEGVKMWDNDAKQISFHDAGFFHCPDAALPTWWTQLPVRAPLLVGWTGGPNAESLLSLASPAPNIMEAAINSLSTIFKLPAADIRNQLDEVCFHDWHEDPFSRGAYAYVPVNGLGAQRVLAEPINGKLLFAGEATSIGHIGTVHGAIQSGLRAARELKE